MLRCGTKILKGIHNVFDWKNNAIFPAITCKIPNNAALKHIMRIRTGDASLRDRTWRGRPPHG
ncbi:hypothetical protein SAMN05428959_10272 [Duganella sp. CF517]|nr:hypothetical protein SAMN05428959_10272 [Duganella sp. CF517]